MVFTISSLYVIHHDRQVQQIHGEKRKGKKYMLAMGYLTINQMSILFLLPVVLVFPKQIQLLF